VRHAYLALRGGEKRQTIIRGPESGHFVGVVCGHGNGDSTAYELQLNNDRSAVVLTVKRPGREVQTLLIDPLAD